MTVVDEKLMPCDDYEYIYVAYITRKNGFRDYAYRHGLKAWRIRVHKDKL